MRLPAGAGAGELPRLALLYLCHEAPNVVAQRLAQPFFEHPDVAVYVHYDGARTQAQRNELSRLLAGRQRVHMVPEPVACEWGTATLVEATLRTMSLALADDGFDATHLVLLSASCVPYRPVQSLQKFLKARPGVEFIQAQNIQHGRWVKDGLERERYEYYFPFHFRTQRKLFDWATARQREFGIRRTVPDGLAVHFGSQWFALTRATAMAVERQLSRPVMRRWLRWSWIPDEFAIQTLVAHLCPPSRVAGFNLTYYEFDPQGMPLVLDNGHFEHLLRQPFFFARKVAPSATRLLEQIAANVAAPEQDLGYFDRVGRATSDFARFQAEVATGSGLRAHLGTPVDGWRGPMASSDRRYYVLHATSHTWLQTLVSSARAHSGGNLPIFILPFDSGGRWADTGAERLLGFSSLDEPRRDHDRASYLFELVHAHPVQPCAFGLDLVRGGALQDLVQADSRAVLIDCDPPLSREQRAAALLHRFDLAADEPSIRAVLQAMKTGAPLPDDGVARRGHASKACQQVSLRDLGADLGDATLVALRTAYHAIPPAAHFPEAGEAWRQFWR